MDLVTVKELYKNREQYFDKEVTVGGWGRSNRDSKAFGFIVVNDGSYFETLQVVYHDTMDNFAEITKLNVGAAIIVKGTLYDRYSTFDDKYSMISHLEDKEYLLMVLPDVKTENIDYITVNNKKYSVLDSKVRFDDNTEELKYLKLLRNE